MADLDLILLNVGANLIDGAREIQSLDAAHETPEDFDARVAGFMDQLAIARKALAQAIDDREARDAFSADEVPGPDLSWVR